jgi:hypothetical protein
MRWAHPTPGRLERLAANLREQDRIEVMASDGLTPAEAVYSSWRGSHICRCILGDDGQEVGICGVNGEVIWLLGTAELTSTRSHRLQLARRGREWVDELMETHKRLHNLVFAANVESVRWLQSLGFTVYPPVPHGPSAQLFSYFERVAP